MMPLTIMALVTVLMLGSLFYYFKLKEGLVLGKFRASQAFNAWRQLFFNGNQDREFNERALASHRDALTSGEYLYFESLVKDTYGYYQKNPMPYIRDVMYDNVIQVTKDDDGEM